MVFTGSQNIRTGAKSQQNIKNVFEGGLVDIKEEEDDDVLSLNIDFIHSTNQVRKAALPPTPVRDPFKIKGWEKIEVAQTKPTKVSLEVWEQVFPGDYEQVKKLAGKLYIFGYEPDQAVIQAQKEIEIEFWKKGNIGCLVETMEKAFGSFSNRKNQELPVIQVRKCICAVEPTAQRYWNEILSSDRIEAAAFRLRTWHATNGKCLVCEQDASDQETKFQGDLIHMECKIAMKTIGPAFAQAVIERAQWFDEYWKNNPVVNYWENRDEDED